MYKKLIRVFKDKIGWGKFYKKSYSQEGEDMILRRIFEKQKSGFYVDVGAHHPKRFSNTYFFYKKGWRGINIDAFPGCMRKFNKIRPRDINIEAAIFDEEKEMDYYMFNMPALNGFSRNLSKDREKNAKNAKIIGVKKIKTRTLENILDENLPSGIKIDFMSVDVEGADLNVLKSNNWEKHLPDYLLIEILFSDFEKMNEDRVYLFLKQRGYRLFAKSFNTAIFKRK